MAEAIATATRREPLAGRLFALNGVSLTPAAAASRVSLRVREDGIKAAEKVLGFALPGKPKTSISKDGLNCLWIGPDEWLLVGSDDGFIAELGKAGNDTLSCVDVSHRNTAVIVTGKRAPLVLNSGCPQDLSLDAFPVGAASRTLLGKSEIILWRTRETEFRVECWRSFSDYVWTFLADAVKSV